MSQDAEELLDAVDGVSPVARRRRTAGGLLLDRAAVAVMEVALHAEIAMDNLVAAWFARDVDRYLFLADAIGQMSVGTRRGLVRDIMVNEAWDVQFPFVLPVLERLAAIRNLLAHSLKSEAHEDGQGGWATERRSIRRGRVTTTEVGLTQLKWLQRSGWAVLRDMDIMFVRSVPADYWGLDVQQPSQRIASETPDKG